MCYTLIPYWLTPEVCHTESDDSSASCCCFSQLLNGMVSAAEGACGTAGDVAGDAVGGRGGMGEWLSLDRRSFNWVIATAVVVGVGSRDGAKVGTQVRIPPWPDAARHVRPDLYLAFSASGSAFQRWPVCMCNMCMHMHMCMTCTRACHVTCHMHMCMHMHMCIHAHAHAHDMHMHMHMCMHMHVHMHM